MIWEFPTFMFSLWLVPVVGAMLVFAHSKRKLTALEFADPSMVARLMPSIQSTRMWLKAILLMGALTCLIIAISRPRFGIFIDDVTSRGVDLFVLLDVSRSMLAEDVAPNRLERAKSDIVDLLERLEGDRVGLIAFAGAPVMQVPLTTDHGYFRLALRDVGPDSAPRGGSLIGDAIRKAIEQLDGKTDRDQAIVLITDGEDQDSFPKEAAKQAADRSIRIIAVGIGDPAEGARIPQRAADGSLKFLQHSGQEVWSKMDERMLKEIALTTSGAYVPAQTRAYDLGRIYNQTLSQMNQGEIRSEKRKRYREQYQWFAAIGISLLIVDLLIPRIAIVPKQTQRAVNA